MVSEKIRIVPESAVLVCDWLAQAFLSGPLQLDTDSQNLWYRLLLKETPAVRSAWQALTDALEGERNWNLAVRDFHECVEVPVPGRYVPPYASCYLDNPAILWGPSTHQVMAWYGQIGLEWQRSFSVTAPDHIGVEWAFLAELSDLSSPEALELRRVFIADHISQWFPVFIDHLRRTVRGSYYPALGDFGIAWIRSEADVHGRRNEDPDDTRG